MEQFVQNRAERREKRSKKGREREREETVRVWEEETESRVYTKFGLGLCRSVPMGGALWFRGNLLPIQGLTIQERQCSEYSLFTMEQTLEDIHYDTHYWPRTIPVLLPLLRSPPRFARHYRTYKALGLETPYRPHSVNGPGSTEVRGVGKTCTNTMYGVPTDTMFLDSQLPEAV